ncbi:mitochondrial fission process protein 1 [Trichonephila inaurata madagascariensis]|uniref:Mitochondrial fission process protein 1 n=1 Tax=Trichonephila inaurata madagascariensis TaxID=2747483 RepID=A0A8X6MA40_9ARAC|nr:mitochondrial fission process protein 1 [Trichonephila inaurata madagascariensis]
MENKPEIDIYRDTPVRLLGYANEVGESFRAFGFHVPAKKILQDGSLLLDAADSARTKKLATSAIDTLVWQTLASVAIPGFTINRLCAGSMYLLKKHSKLPSTTRKWTTVAVGLGSIPFIVKPIDHLVDALMNNTFRKWF